MNIIDPVEGSSLQHIPEADELPGGQMAVKRAARIIRYRGAFYYHHHPQGNSMDLRCF